MIDNIWLWDYSEMLLFLFNGIDAAEKKLQGKLLGKLYDKARIGFRVLVSALISRGCYAEIGSKVRRYQFFAASAGQMRKQRFVLLRDDMYKKHNAAMTLGLSEGKSGDGIVINASKWLPYKSLSLFPGKIAKITTNIIGDNREKWQDKLMEGDIISIQGNIAEVKQNSYGAYIIVYNPEILGARRIRSEAIELDEDNVIESNEQE